MAIATASWKASSTTPTMSNFTGPTRCAASITSARCVRPKRWPAPSAMSSSPRNAGGCSKMEASGSTAISSTGILRAADSRVSPWTNRQTLYARTGGAEDPEHPDFQLGDGCLVDQLIGQYLADIAGLGPLLDPANIRKNSGLDL